METAHYLSLTRRNSKADRVILSDITYLESDSNYTKIHLASGKMKLSCRSLSFHVLHNLNDSFIRIHRSYCVNKLFVKGFDIENDPEILFLKCGTTLNISRRRKKIALENISQILQTIK